MIATIESGRVWLAEKRLTGVYKNSGVLAEKFKLADKVFGVAVPWTNWRWSVFEWYKIKSFANNLNLLNIDLAIDFFREKEVLEICGIIKIPVF